MSDKPGNAKTSETSDILRYTALIAHQLQSPVSAVCTILKTLEGEFVGPLTPRQKDLLARAVERCNESVATMRRMLAIASVTNGDGATGAADMADIVRQTQVRYQQKASQQNIALSVHVDAETAVVRGAEAALVEVLETLLDNAFKYTPEHGQIRLTVAAGDGDRICVAVDDSGVGIPEKDRQRIFEPFFRTHTARSSSRGGVGLGLSLVKAIVEAVGGTVTAGKSDLGGASLRVCLPATDPADLDEQEKSRSANAFKVVIVGGVAAGLKAASKVIRMRPDAVVTVVEKDEFLSYAGCGLPYYISGIIKNRAELMSTPAGVVRDAVFFQKVKHVQVLTRTEAVAVDRSAKTVRVINHDNDRESDLPYDKLILATGASPVVPQIPNSDLKNIFSLHGVRDAEGIKAALTKAQAHDVVIVGGGLIGMEMTEALARSGCRVTIVEMRDQTLSILDPTMAKLVENHLESKGVRVMTGNKVLRFEGNETVQRVVTERGELPADLVIMGIGVRPNVSLAESAGLDIGETGAIKVDEHMATSDPDIYAAGDCAETRSLLTGRPTYIPLGSTANKQGRVAAVNACGGDDVFPGVLGSVVCKVFDYCVGRTGLTETAARAMGYDVTVALAPGPDKANYMPDARPLLLELVVDTSTRKILGLQAVGAGNGDKRIDVAAMAITAGMTVDQLANADLCYAPPYSMAMDNIITAANIARNKLDGQMTGISAEEVHNMLAEKKDFIFLDVRSPGEYEQLRLPDATLIPLSALRGRRHELPPDKPVVTFCEISLRAYEAAKILTAAGVADVRVLDGGMAMWPYEKIVG